MVPAFQREAAALKLYNTERSRQIKPANPPFPTINPENTPDFVSLIGPDSWLLFDLIKMKPNQVDRMQLSVNDWPKMKDYNYVKNVVKHSEVVNDSAERGVKLIQDFKNS